MPDPFAALIPDARAYLSELRANNSRDWFTAHKPRYEAELKTPALHLLDHLAAEIGPGVTTKLFRPQRDVRFSKDKTPYNTHLHMMWTLPADTGQAPALFFGISPDYVSIGGGIMGFDKTTLPAWRDAVAGPDGPHLQTLIDALLAGGYRMDEPDLKRVPAPYDKDHAQAALLRRKSLTLWRDLSPTDYRAPLTHLRRTYSELHPLFERLREIT